MQKMILNSSKFSSLGKIGDKNIKLKDIPTDNITFEDVSYLINELELYKIALEMRNEKLREAKIKIEELSTDLNKERIRGDKQLQIETIQRNKLENELCQSKQNFETLVSVSPVGIWRSDSKGSYTYVNERCSEIIGLSSEEALGDDWAKYLHPEDKCICYKEWKDCVREERQFKLEYRFLLPGWKSYSGIRTSRTGIRRKRRSCWLRWNYYGCFISSED